MIEHVALALPLDIAVLVLGVLVRKLRGTGTRLLPRPAAFGHVALILSVGLSLLGPKETASVFGFAAWTSLGAALALPALEGVAPARHVSVLAVATTLIALGLGIAAPALAPSVMATGVAFAALSVVLHAALHESSAARADAISVPTAVPTGIAFVYAEVARLIDRQLNDAEALDRKLIPLTAFSTATAAIILSQQKTLGDAAAVFMTLLLIAVAYSLLGLWLRTFAYAPRPDALVRYANASEGEIRAAFLPNLIEAYETNGLGLRGKQLFLNAALLTLFALVLAAMVLLGNWPGGS